MTLTERALDVASYQLRQIILIGRYMEVYGLPTSARHVALHRRWDRAVVRLQNRLTALAVRNSK